MRHSHLSDHHSYQTDTPTTEIYTLSLHDALPISRIVAQERELLAAQVRHPPQADFGAFERERERSAGSARGIDRKSTRLNSSHPSISYGAFSLKRQSRA